jgi:uncharacterized protein (TIGR03437 family)
LNPIHLSRIAAAAVLSLAAVPGALAQTPTIVASPTTIVFNLTAGVPAGQPLSVSLSNGQAATATITPSQGLRVNGQNVPINVPLPRQVTITVDPSVVPGATPEGSVRIDVVGLQPTTIPVCYIRTVGSTQCGSGSGGTGVFSANTTSLQFTQTTTTPPSGAQIGLFSATGVLPTYTTSVLYNTGAQNWLQVFPTPGTSSNSSIVTVTPITTSLPAGTYTATLSLLSQTLGYNNIQIPVTLTIGTGSGSVNFNATPGAVTFTYPAGTLNPQTQIVNINAATATGFSVAVSTNLQPWVTVSPVLGTAPGQIAVTVNNPSTVPVNTTGFLTVTSTNSAYPAFQIPITINSSGSTSGSLTVSPTSLTFATAPGSTAPQSQSINVTSTDGTQQVFSVATSSPNGFLTAFASSSVTPATITVGINPSAISQTGTYQGFVTITPQTGVGAGLPITIPVTVNVGTAGIIQATPTVVALEARAGGPRVSTNVRLDVAAGVQAVSFTTSVNTTTGGNWLSVVSSGVAPGQLTINADAASLAPGSYTGRVTVTPTSGNPFDINVTLTVTASGELRVTPATLAFAHQTTASSVPPSQTVQISSTGSPLTWNATASSTGNWLQVSPATGTTGTNALTVSVNPTGLAAGTYNGTVSVSSPNATNPAQTIPVTLTVTTPVIPAIATFSNAASFAPTVVSPGLIATITGTDLGPTTPVTGTVGSTGFPTILGETQVLFDGRPAPILYTSSNQISVIAPFELAGRVSTRVQVEYRGQRSRELELRVTDATPGIFTLNQSGSGQGAVLNQNGSVNGPANPERRGNVVVIYGTGLGAVFPSVGTGALAGTASTTTLPVRVRIGGIEARVLYSGAAPGLVGGAYQVNAVIPETVAPGSAVPVSIEAGSGLSQPTVTIAVQ